MIMKIGFIGLGAMGLPIASNLIKAGYELNVHTKSRKAENDKALKGSSACSNPSEVAELSSILFICVANDDDVNEVLLGEEGAIKTLKEGAFIIDLSTISPFSARSIGLEASKKNITYIDAPVSGGTEGAENASLSMFLGCDEATLEPLLPLLKSIASKIFAFGSIGTGQEVKAINQILIAGTYASVSEAIGLGQHLDLDMELVVNALQTGAASSWVLKNRSSFMIKDKYPLGFKLALHHKDLSIATKIAEKIGIELPVTSKVKDLEYDLVEKGYSEYDLSVLRRGINRKENCSN